jgi:hypothetical protein
MLGQPSIAVLAYSCSISFLHMSIVSYVLAGRALVQFPDSIWRQGSVRHGCIPWKSFITWNAHTYNLKHASLEFLGICDRAYATIDRISYACRWTNGTYSHVRIHSRRIRATWRWNLLVMTAVYSAKVIISVRTLVHSSPGRERLWRV